MSEFRPAEANHLSIVGTPSSPQDASPASADQNSPSERLMRDLCLMLSDQAETWNQHGAGLREMADESHLNWAVTYTPEHYKARAAAFEECAAQLAKIAERLGD